MSRYLRTTPKQPPRLRQPGKPPRPPPVRNAGAFLVNNKAWRSSTTVRRDWLRQFASRKAAPSGAEALIAAAVIGCQPSLGQAFNSRH